MDNGLITAILISFISVFGGIGTGFFIGLVFSANTPSKRGMAFIIGICTTILLMGACMWLIKHGTL